MIKQFKYNLGRANLKIRRDLARYIGLKVKDNYYLDSPLGRPREDVERLSLYSPATTFTRPSLIDDSSLIYNFPRRYIYKIPNAIIDPHTGLIYDQFGKLIAESSSWNITRLLCESPKPKIKTPSTFMSGTYTFGQTTPNYYHWLLEELPPLLSAVEIDSNIKILLKSQQIPLQQTFFSKYFPNNVAHINEPVQVESLIMTGKTCGFGNPFGHNAIHPHDLTVVKNFFNLNKNFLNKENQQKPLKIYLSRTGLRRSPKGEYLLDKALEEMGFIIFRGDMTLEKQIELFSQAAIVVGTSGAAMTNFLWLPKNSKVVKINLGAERFHFYYDLALMLGLEYHSLNVPANVWTVSDIDKIINYIN